MTTGLPEPDPPDDWTVPVSDTSAVPFELPILSVAAFAAGNAVAGWKVTWTVVAAPAASVVVPGEPTENWSAFPPVSTNGVVSVTADPLMFVIVMFVNEDPPTSTEPKSNDVVDAVIEATPLPVMSPNARGNS